MKATRSALLAVLAASALAQAQGTGDCANLQQATVAKPRDGQAWFALAVCQQNSGDKAGADRSFLVAVANGDLTVRIRSELQLFRGGMERPLPAKGCEELSAPEPMACKMPVLACRTKDAMYFAASTDERAKLKAAVESAQAPGPKAVRLEPSDCRIILADECRGLLAYACGPADHPRIRELDLN